METPNLRISAVSATGRPPSMRRLSPQPLGLKQAQNLGDLYPRQLLKPLQHLPQ